MEVMTAEHFNKAAIMSSSRYSQDAAPQADGRAHFRRRGNNRVFVRCTAVHFQRVVSRWESSTGKFEWNVSYWVIALCKFARLLVVTDMVAKADKESPRQGLVGNESHLRLVGSHPA